MWIFRGNESSRLSVSSETGGALSSSSVGSDGSIDTSPIARSGIGSSSGSNSSSVIRCLYSPLKYLIHNRRTRRWVKRALRLFALLLYFIVGIVFYKLYEGWDWTTSVFFTIVTICTIGYGRSTPTDDTSRLFTVFYMLCGIYLIFNTAYRYCTNKGLSEVKLFVKNNFYSSLRTGRLQPQKRVLITAAMIVVCVFVGVAFFMINEKWSFVSALYFAVETSTTVGYGDLQVQHDSTRLFLCFYMLLSCMLVIYLVNNIGVLREQKRGIRKRRKMLRQKQTLDSILNALTSTAVIGTATGIPTGNNTGNGIDPSVNYTGVDSALGSAVSSGVSSQHQLQHEGNSVAGGVTKHQFVLAILQHLLIVDAEQHILPWFEKFDELDVAGTGRLNHLQLQLFCQREMEQSRREMFEMVEVSHSSLLDDLLEMGSPTTATTVRSNRSSFSGPNAVDSAAAAAANTNATVASLLEYGDISNSSRFAVGDTKEPLLLHSYNNNSNNNNNNSSSGEQQQRQLVDQLIAEASDDSDNSDDSDFCDESESFLIQQQHNNSSSSSSNNNSSTNKNTGSCSINNRRRSKIVI